MWRHSDSCRRTATATIGALVIHIALGWFGTHMGGRYQPELDRVQPTPRVSIVDVELTPEWKPAASPAPSRMPQNRPTTPIESPRPTVRQPGSRTRTTRTTPDTSHPVARVDLPTTGAIPTISVPELGLSATGRGMADAAPATSGAASTAPGSDESTRSTTSIATIKTRAMPRGDFAYSLLKDYPVEARQRGIEGKLRVKLTVDERGIVTAANLLNSLGYGLDDLATRRAWQLAFDPARDTNDKPVRSVVIWTFHFTLPE